MDALPAPEQISFPTPDHGVVYANLYGSGGHTVILAHGIRFNKESWHHQAQQLAAAGYRVLAIDFRGYGKSEGGPNSTRDDMFLDVLAAADYLRAHGGKTVAVIGGSMGGGAAANAVVKGPAGAIDRVILLAHAPIAHPERITGPKLFLTAQDDPIAPNVREQYEKAPDPKELIVLEGAAHAQFLFTTDQAPRLMKEILRFLAG